MHRQHTHILLLGLELPLGSERYETTVCKETGENIETCQKKFSSSFWKHLPFTHHLFPNVSLI